MPATPSGFGRARLKCILIGPACGSQQNKRSESGSSLRVDARNFNVYNSFRLWSILTFAGMWEREMRRYLLIFLVSIVCSAGAVQAQTETDRDYTLAPGDRIEISVLEDPSLNRQALVRPDGKISMPLAGTVEAAGRTPEEVASLIRQRLARDFIEPPSVTVSLLVLGAEEDIVQPSFYVLGEVRQAGRYALDEEKPVTVLQALAIAGGLDVFAARKRVQVRRQGAEGDTLRLFDYDAAESGDQLPPPFFLEDGDVIIVPERGLFE